MGVNRYDDAFNLIRWRKGRSLRRLVKRKTCCGQHLCPDTRCQSSDLPALTILHIVPLSNSDDGYSVLRRAFSPGARSLIAWLSVHICGEVAFRVSANRPTVNL